MNKRRHMQFDDDIKQQISQIDSRSVVPLEQRATIVEDMVARVGRERAGRMSSIGRADIHQLH